MACVGCGAFGLLLAAGSARADMDQPAGADTVSVGTTPTSKSVASITHELGSVVAIDRTARTMTIKNAAGTKHTIDVPPEVSYFDKLKLGDKVAIDYHASMAISMLPAGTKPSTSEQTTMMKTGNGAGVIGRQMQVSAEVVAVDAANDTVTFKGRTGTCGPSRFRIRTCSSGCRPSSRVRWFGSPTPKRPRPRSRRRETRPSFSRGAASPSLGARGARAPSCRLSRDENGTTN